MRHEYELRSEHLMLRPLGAEDIEYVRLLRNREENRHHFLYSEKIDEKAQQAWYRNYLEKPGDYMFVIKDIQTAENIGTVAIYDVDPERRVGEFGRLMIDQQKKTAKGLGYEATLAACEIAFSQIGLRRLVLEVFADNRRAADLYRRAGFRTVQETMHQEKPLYRMVCEGPKKILFVASRLSHITNFHLPYIEELHRKRHRIHVMGEGEVSEIPFAEKIHRLSFDKKISSLRNIRTIRSTAEILQKERYDLIITNSTLAGFIVRMAKKRVRGGRLIHISHGYLFSEDTPPLKKALYLEAERLCKGQTDLLLVMNQEDLRLAKKHRLADRIAFIRGMGIPKIDVSSFDSGKQIRKRYGCSPEDFLAVYPAELSKRKNHAFLIDHLAEQLAKNPQIRMIFPGDGDLKEFYQQQLKGTKIEKNIIFPGYVREIKELIHACDLAISSAKSEGLPFNIMEAMCLGVPVLASRVKGHVDLIEDGENGRLFSLDDPAELIENFRKMIEDRTQNQIFVQKSIQKIQAYQIDRLLSENIDKIESVFEDSSTVEER